MKFIKVIFPTIMSMFFHLLVDWFENLNKNLCWLKWLEKQKHITVLFLGSFLLQPTECLFLYLDRLSTYNYPISIISWEHNKCVLIPFKAHPRHVSLISGHPAMVFFLIIFALKSFYIAGSWNRYICAYTNYPVRGITVSSKLDIWHIHPHTTLR